MQSTREEECLEQTVPREVTEWVVRVLGPRTDGATWVRPQHMISDNELIITSSMHAKDLKKTIEDIKNGLIEFKADKSGTVHAGIGKISFTEDKLEKNITDFVEAIIKAKGKRLLTEIKKTNIAFVDNKIPLKCKIDDWFVYSVKAGSHYSAALAVNAEIDDHPCYDFRSLLWQD